MQPRYLFHSQPWRWNEVNINPVTLNTEVLHAAITLSSCLPSGDGGTVHTNNDDTWFRCSLKFPQCEPSSCFVSQKTKRSSVKLNAKQIQFHTLRYSTASFNLFDSHKDAVEPHRNSCPLLARCCSMDNPAKCGRVCCAEQLRAVSFRGVGKGICCTGKCWEPVHLWCHWVNIRRSNLP